MPNHESFRAASRANYQPAHVATTEQINAGSLQRIADATEVMAQNHLRLQGERDNYLRYWEEERAANKHLRAQVAAHKAVATKLKKQLAAAQAVPFAP